ncbi:unnamed protein product [Mytilus coruscus]|uniref:Integrase catalytic domain-containing protein n=1 Tax=Mytilus coruscus TaxID=42192 RepID=A0A6J8E058_MYTCO|nr:unnamed protein product [Mytilus coruscus]
MLLVSQQKGTDNVAHLLIEEITSRHSGIQILTSDNGGENCSKAMEEVCKELNIKHIKTSFYHPQGNAKIERFHRTLHDVLSKLIEDHSTTWDLYLNQALAAIRFNINESIELSPFYALYNRDPVLPLDNILQPRRKYNGEEYHKIALQQQQHKSFMLVHKTMKKSKQKQAKYANKHSKDIKFEVGNPVFFYKNHRRASKLSRKWTPYYRIIEQSSPVSFILKNQLDGTTTKAHAEQIRLAELDWEIPNNNQGKALRKAAYVVPVESQSEDSSDDESIDSNTPLNQIAKRYKKETENSDEEDDIPLMELSKKLRGKTISSEQDNVNNGQIESDDQVIKEEVENSPSDSDVSDIDDNMSITHPSPVASEISDMEDNMPDNRVKITNNRKPPVIGANETKLVTKEHVQNLVRALIGSIMADNEDSFAQLHPLPTWKLLPPELWWNIYCKFMFNHFQEEESVTKWWWFSLVLFGLTSQFIVKENVMFQKIKEISTTRSNWLITFVVDLDPFKLFLNKIEQDLNKALSATQKVHTISMFYTPGKKHILATILNLQREVEGLNRTKDYLRSQFNDYKSLYYDATAKFRTKGSLFPIIGKTFSFLFGTVSDSDLSKIRRNIKTLAQNQDEIRHIVQDGLTILNTKQTHVSENRHKVNELIESVQDLGNRLKTFATNLEKQIEVMGSYLQAYLHMDMIIGEIKDLMNIAGDYLNHLQLNMLSLGPMSPSLISPAQVVFTVHRNLKKAKTKQKEYADKNRQEINFKVGDAVYFKNHLRKSNLDSKWKLFYRIIEQRSPVSFIVKNQLTGSTTKVHAQHLKPAPVETWDVPKSNEIKKLRKSRFVVPPESSESEMEVDNEENETVENRTSFRNRLIRKNMSETHLRMKLKKRINIRNKSLNSKEVLSSETDEDDEIPLSKLKRTLKSDASDESDVTIFQIEKICRLILKKMAGVRDLIRMIQLDRKRDRINHIINELSHVAYSDCRETLANEGLKPLIIYRIAKTADLKAKVILETDLMRTLAQEITRRYDKPEKGFKNTFPNLRNEFRLLTDTHTSILRIFNDYKALHRNKRSVLPIIGKAMHFLFGTLKDSDVSTKKEILSILNVTRIEVSENRHAINSLIGDLREINSKLENVTEEFEKQIIDLENYIQQYVQLDLITGELKLLMQKAMFYLEHLGSKLNML